MEQLATQLLHHLAAHPHWAQFFVFAIAFLESVAVIGSVVPAAACLFIAGTLIGTGQLAAWSTLGWSILGAVLGDGLSYWLGYRYRHEIRKLWIFSRYPTLITKGEEFFARHGGKSVAIGRFVGPVRAVVPVIAGMVGMLPARFYLMNVLSALAWGPVHLLPGILFGASLKFAGELATRLTVFFILLAALLWLIVWLLRVLLRWMTPFVLRLKQQALVWAETRQSFRARLLNSLLHPDHPASPTLFTTTATLLIGVWIFSNVLSQILGQHALASVDRAVFNYLQALRTPWLDHLMMVFTYLGDSVALISLTLVVTIWLLARQRYTSMFYWLSAIGFAQVLVPLLKLALSRPRPIDVTTELQIYSFPSSHATLSMVTYGFLAFMIGRELKARPRLILACGVGVLVSLIAFSRLYLGEHWLSDVVGGIGLGLAWLSLLGIAYSYHERGELGARRLLGLSILTVLLAVSWRVAHPHGNEIAPYRASTPVSLMTEMDWLKSGWQRLPAYRTDIVGRANEPFLLQIAGDADAVKNLLIAQGWREPPDNSPLNLLQWVNPKVSPLNLPVLPRLHSGMNAGITLERAVPGQEAERIILRLWPTQYLIEQADHTDAVAPLWIGAFTMEKIVRPLSAVNLMVPARVMQIAPWMLHDTPLCHIDHRNRLLGNDGGVAVQLALVAAQ